MLKQCSRFDTIGLPACDIYIAYPDTGPLQIPRWHSVVRVNVIVFNSHVDNQKHKIFSGEKVLIV